MAKPVRGLTDEIPWPRKTVRTRMNCFNIPHQDGVDHSVHNHAVHDYQEVKVIASNLEKKERRISGCVQFHWDEGCACTRTMENNAMRKKLWKGTRAN